MLRLASYGASSTPAHGHPKGPAAPATPASQPPAEAFPPPPAPKSTDLLIHRAVQLKRIAKGTAAFYQGIAEAHNSHSLTLRKLSAPGTTPIPTPFPEASIFLPLLPSDDHHPSASSASTPSAGEPDLGLRSLGGTGAEGWQQILQDARDTNARTADAHQDLARRITKEVVGPLLRCRVDLKQHIALMEKDLNKHVDAVQRERDTAAPLLARLAASLRPSSSAAAASFSSPLDDPVLLRAQVEAQLRAQVLRENDLLAAVQTWSQRTQVKERDTFVEIKQCWAAWEQAHSAMLLGNQQQSMFLSATVDSVPPEAEWTYFLRLNHLVLPDTPPKTLDDVRWEGKGHPLTTVVREGLLERQTSILKSWKPAYFILTPSGHLHIYGPPPASVTAPTGDESAPTTSTTVEDIDIDLSGSTGGAGEEATESSPYPALSSAARYLLLHSSPHLSLNLALCTLGPMPTPVAPARHSASSPTTPDEVAARKKKQPLDAVFTLIETLGKGGKGEGSGTRHVVRCKGEDGGWEEMGGWVAKIGQFCAAPTLPPPPASPPTPPLPSPPPSPPPSSGPTRDVGQEEDILVPPSGGVATPPARRILPPSFFGGALGGGTTSPPPLPSRPSSSLSSFLPPPSPSSTATPPALPPRDAPSDLTTAAAVPSGAFDADADGAEAPPERNSVLSIDDEDNELSRAAWGVLGGEAAREGFEGGAEAKGQEQKQDGRDLEDGDEPRSRRGRSEETATDGDDDEAGDLGRSLSVSSSSARRRRDGREHYASPSASVESLTPPAGDVEEGPTTAEADVAVLRDEDEDNEDVASSEASGGSRSLSQSRSAVGDDSFDRDGVSEAGAAAEGTEEPAIGAKALGASSAKKGKKKRKSKGGAAAAAAVKPTERPLPLPSVDPEHTDLGVSSAHSPSLADAQPLELDLLHGDDEETVPVASEQDQEGDAAEANEEAEELQGLSEPPVGTEPEEGEEPPARSSEERRRSGDHSERP